jgi:hypothetical protein
MLFAATYSALPDQGSFDSPKRTMVDLLTKILSNATVVDASGVLELLKEAPGGLSLMGQGLAALSSDGDEASPPPPEWLPEVAAKAVDMIRSHFADGHYDDPRNMSSEDIMALWAWGVLDGSSRRAWLRREVHDGRWHVIDLFAGLQQGAGVYTNTGLMPVVGEVRLSKFDEYLGLDFVMERVEPFPEGLQAKRHHMHEANPTFEDRREAVAAVLQGEAARRRERSEQATS